MVSALDSGDVVWCSESEKILSFIVKVTGLSDSQSLPRIVTPDLSNCQS